MLKTLLSARNTTRSVSLTCPRMEPDVTLRCINDKRLFQASLSASICTAS